MIRFDGDNPLRTLPNHDGLPRTNVRTTNLGFDVRIRARLPLLRHGLDQMPGQVRSHGITAVAETSSNAPQQPSDHFTSGGYHALGRKRGRTNLQYHTRGIPCV